MLKKSLILIIGSLAYAFLNWIILAQIVQNWGLSAAGEYSFVLAVLTPLFTVIFMGFRSSLAKDFKKKESPCFLLTLRVAMMAIIFLIVIFILENSSLNKSAVQIFYLIFMIKAIDGACDIAYGVYQRDGQPHKQGISLIARSLIGGGAFLIGSKFGELFFAFLFVILSWIAYFIFYDSRNLGCDFRTKNPIKNELFALTKIKYLIILNLPMVMASALGAYVFNVPRYAIEFFYSSEILGEYAVLSAFAVAFNICISMLGQNTVPYVTKLHAAADRVELIKFIKKIISIVILMTIFFIFVMMVFGKFLFMVFFGVSDDIYGIKILISSIAFVPFFIGGFLSFLAIGFGAYKMMFNITIVSGIILSVLCIPVVAYWNLYGGFYLISLLGFIQILGYSMIINKSINQ